MSNSMKDDLNSILEKTGNTPLSEVGESESETVPVQEIERVAPGTSGDVKESHKAISFAQQLQMTRQMALEQERDLKKNLKAIQEQDPALAKKIKLVAIGTVILIIIFVAVIIKTSKGGEELVNTPAKVDNGGAVAVESEYDKSKAAQDVNDKLRVDNLTNIAQLAVVYHLEQKADLPVSATLVKLNEANPVVEFLQEVLTKYGNSTGVLLDPKNPEYYYGYRSSDGKSIELSARLENETGKYCQTGSSPCIYKKVITEAEMAAMGGDLEKYK